MRIAMLAPPWIPVPPPGYGGIEEVVRLLCEGFVARGHDVTLFAPPESRSCAKVRTLLDEPHPDEIERSRWEVDHVARAFAVIDAEAARGRPFDVVHDHCGFAALAMADRLATPLVHTLHGPLDDDLWPFYAEHGHKGAIVALSVAQLEGAPPALRNSPVISNPLEFSEWPVETEPGEHLLWVGRMAAIKGPHRAIDVARRAGAELVLAGPVQPGQEEFFAEEVEPHLDDPLVRYVGEVGGEDKRRLYGCARALLMPIRWAEPFGLVMTEAMASGTPVIAFREGSAPELIEEGVNGFLVDDEEEMAAAVARLDEIDRLACRAHAEERFGVPVAARAYEAVFAEAVARRGRRLDHPFKGSRPACPPPRAPRAAPAPTG